MCLGDILLSCAIEEVRKRVAQDSHGASTYIWLVLARFSNIPALHLYLVYGFEIIGFYEAESEVLLAVHNVGDESTRKALRQVTGKLESRFSFLSMNPSYWVHKIICVDSNAMSGYVVRQMSPQVSVGPPVISIDFTAQL